MPASRSRVLTNRRARVRAGATGYFAPSWDEYRMKGLNVQFSTANRLFRLGYFLEANLPVSMASREILPGPKIRTMSDANRKV